MNGAPHTAAFDEDWYLRRNPDIAAAVASGVFASGHAHWLRSGRAENRVPPPGFGGEAEFAEAAYLLANPDVADAVAAGGYPSGQAHYDQVGQAEGRPLRLGAEAATSSGAATASASFDESWYLDQNRDVAGAIAAGAFASAYDHWATNGRHEGRSAPPGFDENTIFDEAFYLSSYPEVAGEIGRGRAANPQRHHAEIGRFRGYLANGFAPRPLPQPGAGGLWTDAGDAPDIVDGREATGQVTAEQADLLRHWIRHGYVILPQALPAGPVDRAAAVLRAAFDGNLPGARFDCPSVSPYGSEAWSPVLQARPARAVDLHWLSPEVRDLVFLPQLRGFLELVFGRTVLASRSYGVLHGFPQDDHRDTSELPFSMPRQAATCCIALDDVDGAAGGVTYFPGSHRLPLPLFGKVHHSLSEARRLLPRPALRDAGTDHAGALRRQLRDAALPAHAFRARKGDAIIWNPALVHGGMPVPDRATAGLFTHFCPRGIVPLSFEGAGRTLRWHGDAGQYASDLYTE